MGSPEILLKVYSHSVGLHWESNKFPGNTAAAGSKGLQQPFCLTGEEKVALRDLPKMIGPVLGRVRNGHFQYKSNSSEVIYSVNFHRINDFAIFLSFNCDYFKVTRRWYLLCMGTVLSKLPRGGRT